MGGPGVKPLTGNLPLILRNERGTFNELYFTLRVLGNPPTTFNPPRDRGGLGPGFILTNPPFKDTAPFPFPRATFTFGRFPFLNFVALGGFI